MEKIVLQVEGMSCAHCEKAVTNALLDMGAKKVKASAKKNTVEVAFTPETLTVDEIIKEIKELGYHV